MGRLGRLGHGGSLKGNRQPEKITSVRVAVGQPLVILLSLAKYGDTGFGGGGLSPYFTSVDNPKPQNLCFSLVALPRARETAPLDPSTVNLLQAIPARLQQRANHAARGV
jgi:hypothetical protein